MYVIRSAALRITSTLAQPNPRRFLRTSWRSSRPPASEARSLKQALVTIQKFHKRDAAAISRHCVHVLDLVFSDYLFGMRKILCTVAVALLATELSITAARAHGNRLIEGITQRVSRLSGWCVAILVISGACIAYNTMGLGSNHLVFSAYGQTLVAKVSVFAVIAGIGGYNRFRLVPTIGSASARHVLLRNVGVECLLMVGARVWRRCWPTLRPHTITNG